MKKPSIAQGRVYAQIDPVLLAKAKTAANKRKWTFTTYLEEALTEKLANDNES